MATVNSQQILIPKKVYIGDGAELTISFSSTHEIVSWNWAGELNAKEYDIQDFKIEKSGVNYYQISIRFVPWKTGQIQFPDLELIYSESLNSIEGTEAAASTLLKIEPVQIVSLVEQNQVTGIRGATNPMLIPGTAYRLYGSLIAGVLILLVLIRSLIKRKHIAQFIREKKLQAKYRRNKRKTLRTLNNLLKAPESKEPKETAEIIQKSMRSYLEIRFEYPFTKTVSSEIVTGFMNATSNLAENKKMTAIEDIAGTFIRTDFIRYGSGSFLENELNETIENLKSNIEILEAAPPKVVDIH